MFGTNVTGKKKRVSSVVCLLMYHDLFIDVCTATLMDVVSHGRVVFEE